MKKSKILLSLCLVLAVFFLLWSVAELFYAQGRDKVPQKGLAPLRWAMKLFPLQGEYAGEAGFALVEQGDRDKDPLALKASISLFKDAIRKNPLDHRSHYYLAKAYLQLSAVANDYFDLGVSELRRAAVIRGSNKQIALDCSRVYFSLWPLLEADDQEFATGLLERAMPSLAWEEFRELVEMWSLYVQDTTLLNAVLSRRPDFYGPVADQLVASGIPLDWRWRLLDQYEQYSLDASDRLYNEKLLNNEMDGEQARQLLHHLRVRGYFRLITESQFKADHLKQLERQLLLVIINDMLADLRSDADLNKAKELRDYIQRFIDEQVELNSLEVLQKLLNENEYFKDNDFSTLRLKTMISLRKGDYSGVISEIEALRKGIAFVKKEQIADYTDILLMLVDAYYSSKLMTAAEQVAAELQREQPDNPDVLWRVLRVQKILGDEGAPDKALNEKLAVVENSRFVTVSKPNATFDVYLFNQPQVELVFAPALIAVLKPDQLVQVFINDKIAFESYVNGLPAKVGIGQPFLEIERKVRVQVNVL